MTTHPAFRVSWVAYACLFASGAASLVYELIWFRHLTLVFGASLYALSAVLCAFMMGLAGGAWAMGQVLTRADVEPGKLIRVYGLLEGLIGLYALCFPLGLELLEKLYPLILPASGQVGLTVHLFEFFLSTLLMFPATLLMGATLPLVGCWATGNQTEKVFTQVSSLYGVNTFGAVFGCLFTQFFAIRLWGVQGATIFAIGLNAMVFILCCCRPRIFYAVESSQTETKKHKRKKEADTEVSPAIGILVFIMFAYSGLASLSSEILWTRILVFPMGSTLYSFALILATFLLGIALGSLTANKLLGRSHRVLKFIGIEIAIGVFCIAILPVLANLTEWTSLADGYFYSLDSSPENILFIRSLFAFALMFLPTFGFGLLFPLANHIYSYRFEGVEKGVEKGVGKILGNTYSINTVGAVLGTILTPFVFIPFWGIRLSLYGIYAVLILFGVYLMARVREFRSATTVMTLGAVFFFLVLGKGYWVPDIETRKAGQGNFARLEINVPADRISLLDYKEGEYSTISVVEDKESRARTIYLDGFSTATVSSSFSGSTYMQAMGFVPMALHPAPKRVLVIGFGTGNTMGTASLFPGAEVHGVEIDKNVLEFSKWFSRWNHDVLNRANTKIYIQDGRTFLKWSKSAYDVIIMEPMSPLQAGVVNLYSKEFYELALSHLKEDGLLVQWLPLHLVGPEDARSITHTFREVFPEFSVWNSFLTRIVMLVGSRNPVTLDKNHFETLMGNAEIKQMAEEMKVHSFLDFADFYIADGKRLSPFLEGAGEITDDSPLLEFSSVSLLPPLQWETDESFLNLLRYRLDQVPEIKGMPVGEQEVFKQDYAIRTAQRFGLFARRYHGPGENFFASGNYFAGLEALRVSFESQQTVHLRNAKWAD